MNDFRPFDPDVDDPVKQAAIKILNLGKVPVKKEEPKKKEAVEEHILADRFIESMYLAEGGPSRKHFVQVAQIIKTIKNPKEKQRMADHHAGLFASQNQRFDHRKWHGFIGTKYTAPKPTGTTIGSAPIIKNATQK